MNKQQGSLIVDGLRNAQAAGAAVVELNGADARNFNWVTVREREVLLGSFCVESGKKFFALVASTPRSTEDFQFMVYEKFKGSPVLTTRSATDGGLLWTYQATKQSGDNQARKRAFFDAAKSDSITIPFPTRDITAFSAAVTRAIELRHLADAAGGAVDADDEADDIDDAENASDESALAILKHLYPEESQLKEALRFLAGSIRFAHKLTSNAWAVHVANKNVRLSVCALRVLELRPGEVTIIVDHETVDAKLRASLNGMFELGNPRVKNPYGQVTAPTNTLATLPLEVRIAHETFISHAATTTPIPNRPAFTPFSNYHQPSILEQIDSILGEKVPRPAYAKASQPRYWKIAPGEKGVNWDECRSGGFIGIGWNALGDLTDVTEEEFHLRAEEHGGSDQVWVFRK